MVVVVVHPCKVFLVAVVINNMRKSRINRKYEEKVVTFVFNKLLLL